jgi:hypothetical protein
MRTAIHSPLSTHHHHPKLSPLASLISPRPHTPHHRTPDLHALHHNSVGSMKHVLNTGQVKKPSSIVPAVVTT